MTEFLLYGGLIFLAGFIDSIAGGGGLITVPVLSLIVGPGAEAIATNKILGVASAVTSFLVYTRNGHLNLRGGLPFLGGVLGGTIAGATVASLLPPEIFKTFLLIVCPVILWTVWNRDALTPKPEARIAAPPLLILLGSACGFYDGVFGPGGGTFMFLALVFAGGMPLMGSMAAARLANSVSAGGSLVTYALHGQVHWSIGLPLAGFILTGAWLGSNLANRKAQKIVKPVLTVVVILLLIRILTS